MFLDTKNKVECYACEACVQICPKNALSMREDADGFRYPHLDENVCVKCGLCRMVCPYEHTPEKQENDKYVFGGYSSDKSIRFQSTSGGAFSAIVDAFGEGDYVIFGAETTGLDVFHSYVLDKRECGKYRKSKYSQSCLGSSYRDVKQFLKEGKKVLFSGTPCQVAGLLSFLDVAKTNRERLLTIEVVCEGVPSPLYIRKLEKEVEKKYGAGITSLDYRYTGSGFLSKGKWDFQIMRLKVGERILAKDRWFNPFWSVWLQHLMSRPSCYKCDFAEKGRVADITLGDLWGVHLYCPELYGSNGGSSLVVCNTEKGKEIFSRAKKYMYGHELDFEVALKYQGPMRSHIKDNPRREECMSDLRSDMDYQVFNRKWAAWPSLKLLFQKYVWGNRQKIFVWYLKKKFLKRVKKC